MNRAGIAKLLAVAAGVCGIVAIVTRPFIFAPLGLIFLLISAKELSDRRYTGVAAVVLVIGSLAGTAVAAAYTKPLY